MPLGLQPTDGYMPAFYRPPSPLQLLASANIMEEDDFLAEGQDPGHPTHMMYQWYRADYERAFIIPERFI